MARKARTSSTQKVVSISQQGQLGRAGQPSKAGRQSLRIIGGDWRGRKIPFTTVAGLRPTQDRVRETLFNWIAAPIVRANCLDLCAGTGALGLEALSRGAKGVTFVDLSSVATNVLKDNLKLLALGDDQNSTVEQMSGFEWLRRYTAQASLLEATETAKRFDLVFLDPPFALNLMQDLIDALHASGCLANNASIYVEQASALADLTLPAQWKLHRNKKAGQVHYGLISC